MFILFLFIATPDFNSLLANPTKWSNTLKQFVGKLPTNCLSVFGHFVILLLKRLSFALTYVTALLHETRSELRPV